MKPWTKMQSLSTPSVGRLVCSAYSNKIYLGSISITSQNTLVSNLVTPLLIVKPYLKIKKEFDILRRILSMWCFRRKQLVFAAAQGAERLQV